MRIFAFGTLKRGFPLHEQGLSGAAYRGLYRTVERFPLVVAGPWFAPMMLDQPGTGLQVRGELYDIEESRLPAIDALESVGTPGNYRRLLNIEPATGGRACQAFAFLKAPALAVPVHSEWLAEYNDNRFVPPSQRAC